MKRISVFSKIVFGCLVMFSLSGCFQYPEGPWFTLQTHDERIQGTWAMISATDASGNDITSEYLTTNISVEVSRSGDRVWLLFKDGNLYSSGTFQFASHGDQLIVVYSLYQNLEEYIQLFYDIRKLTDKEFIFRDADGNEFDMKKF